MGDRRHAALGISGAPSTDGFAGDAEPVGEVRFRETEFASVEGTDTEGFEDFVRQVACIG
jgi:hypothetical protein